MAMWKNAIDEGRMISETGILMPNVTTMKIRIRKVLEAFQCALYLQGKLGTFEAAGKILRIKIGISAGDVSAICKSLKCPT